MGSVPLYATWGLSRARSGYDRRTPLTAAERARHTARVCRGQLPAIGTLRDSLSSASQRVPHSEESVYRGTSLIRNQPPMGPYSSAMPRALWRSSGGGRLLTSEVPM